MAGQRKAESRVPPKARDLLKQIAVCRHINCPVPSQHPFYWSEEPVAPVVPTYLKTGNIMVIAAYPTAMFANFKKEKHVPYYDVPEPLADNRYYDGTGVRDVKAGTYFDVAYLKPLGLLRGDLWITNTVKCFLFDKRQSKRHKNLAMIKPIRILPIRERFFEAAKPCVATHLIKEVEICKPRLIITLGSEAAEALHGTLGAVKEKPEELKGRLNFKSILGIPLLANKRLEKKDTNGHFLDKREGAFFDTNVFHLIHPGYLMRVPEGKLSKEHWSQNLPVLFDFIKGLGLKQSKETFEKKDKKLETELNNIVKECKHEVDHGAEKVTV